jgi:hypothetical protein
MRLLPIAALLVCAAPAQTIVTPQDIPGVEKQIAPHDREKVLRCDVEPIKAELNFGLRFQTGYVLRVPLVQYSGAGHKWQIDLKVTPEGGDAIYLMDRLEFPGLLKPEYAGETSGSFLLGEGHYEVAFAAVDDKDRVCRKEWSIDAAIGRGDRGVKVAIPVHTVADLSWIGPETASQGVPAARRLTILMNGSDPYVDRRPNPFRREIVPVTGGPKIDSMRDYRSVLVGILASLLEKLPGTTIRLVVFDLDQQKETLRQDAFTLKDLTKAEHAANNTDHWAVTVSELQDRPDKWGLLANLVEQELHSEEPSDAVMFLGPRIGPLDKMPAHLVDGLKGPRFFYLQYRLSAEPIAVGIPNDMSQSPLGSRRQAPMTADDQPVPEVSDPIDLLVTKLKGKTLRVHSPTEFAKAVDEIRRARP